MLRFGSILRRPFPRIAWRRTVLIAFAMLALALGAPLLADVNHDNNFSATDAFAPAHPKYWLPDNPTPNLSQLITGLEAQAVDHPDDAETWHQLGLAYRDNLQFDKEADALKKAVALKGATAQMWMDMAHGYMATNEMHSAADAFKTATDLDPDNITAWNDYATLLMTTQDSDLCRTVIEKAQSLHPNSARLWTTLGLLEENDDENEQAIYHFGKSLDADPTYGFAAADLGFLLWKLRRYSDAVEPLIQAINLRPFDGLSWQTLAQCEMQVGTAQEAVPRVQKLVDAHPDAAAGWNILGRLQSQANLDPTASLLKAVKIDPKYGNAWDGLGRTYAAQNRMDDALTAFTEATKVDGKNAEWWNDLGYCQLELGKVDAAIASLQDSLRHAPYFTRPMVNLAQAYSQKGEKELMLETLARLDRTDPDLGAKTRKALQAN
jgi:tetratricopeptide (TPR) repeat protein